jgi:hypothetical protein
MQTQADVLICKVYIYLSKNMKTEKVYPTGFHM